MVGWRNSTKINYLAAAVPCVYVAIEALRYVKARRLRARLDAGRTTAAPTFNRREWYGFFRARLLREASWSPESTKDFLSNCFWGVPFEVITRRDMLRLLLLFSTGHEELEGTHTVLRQGDAMELLEKLEMVLQYEFPHSSYSPEQDPLPFIRINNPATGHLPTSRVFDPLPLALFKTSFRTCGDVMLKRFCGLDLIVDSETGIRFWCRAKALANRGTPEDEEEQGQDEGRCLVLLPGLGFGLVPYLPMVSLLLQAHTGPFIALEMPGISYTPLRDSPTPFPRTDEIAAAVRRIVSKCNHEVADFVGHSYGGVLLSYVQQHEPTIVRRSVFMETPTFFSNSSKMWPLVLDEVSWAKVFYRAFVQRDLIYAIASACFAEPYHQHCLHNAISFFEYCHREGIAAELQAPGRGAAGLETGAGGEERQGERQQRLLKKGERRCRQTLDADTLVVLGDDDLFVDGKAVAGYLGAFHPQVPVYLFPRKNHGGNILPGPPSLALVFARARALLSFSFSGKGGESEGAQSRWLSEDHVVGTVLPLIVAHLNKEEEPERAAVRGEVTSATCVSDLREDACNLRSVVAA